MDTSRTAVMCSSRLRQGGLSPQAIVYVTLCAVLFAILYQPVYQVMVTWWGGEDYNHCYFVPLIVLYLIWEKRSELGRTASYRSWLGLVPLLVGIACYWLGELGGEFYIIDLSSWLVMFGAVWIYLGWRKLKIITFPLAFLIAMFPFPNFINNNLTLKLKLISSQLGVLMLHAYGLSAYREGNVIDLGFTQLQVVDACSGLRYFLPLIILGILLAYFFKAPWWKRMLLVLAAVPVSIITNSLRIASVGVFYQFMGASAAEGFFHDFSGWLIFMASLAMLLLLMIILKRIPGGRVNSVPSSSQAADRAVVEGIPDRPPVRGFSFVLMVPVLILGSTIAVSANVDFREKIPLKTSFASFPEQVGEWRGSRQVMEKIYLDELGLSDYVIMDYRNGSGRQINLYTAYNASQIKGKSSHSPSSCLPGNGWEFKNSGDASIPLQNGSSLIVNRALIEKNAQRLLTYYWFPQRGRVLHNLVELKFYNFWDALTKRRTDGALVRIMTPVEQNETIQDVDRRLQRFVQEFMPVLDRFLPGKDV